MSTYLSVDVQTRLEDADDHRCTYCRTSEANTGQPMTVDHILPRAQGGLSAFNNLCFACRRCNEFKAGHTHAEDPLTGERVSLFHPRQNDWDNPHGRSFECDSITFCDAMASPDLWYYRR